MNITRGFGRSILVAASFSLAACVLDAGSPEEISETQSALGGSNSFLYFRSNATGWGVDNVTRLSQLPSRPNVFGRLYSVEQSWMITDADTAIVTETNQLNGWGTFQAFYGPADKRMVVPEDDRLILQAPGGDAHFKVKYAVLDLQRVLVDINPALLTPAQPPIITIQLCALQLDQQQPAIENSVSFAIGGSSHQKLAQVVTPGMTGQLVEVRFPVSCSSGSDLVVEIRNVVSGTPGSVVLTSQTISGTAIPPANPPVFRRLAFTSPVSIGAGGPFAIVLTSSGDCGLASPPAGNLYPGGGAFFESLPNPPGFIPITPEADLSFQTVVLRTDGVCIL